MFARSRDRMLEPVTARTAESPTETGHCPVGAREMEFP
jgi:hypothetical protein